MDAKGRFAIYPGTFDPLTNGHVGIIRRGLRMFDTLIVAVAEATGKSPLFSLEERVELARTALAEDSRVRVEPFSGLLMRYAEERGACALLRGLRAISDFDYEFQSALMNRHLNQSIETIFLMTDYRWLYTSSTIIKTVAALGGDVSNLVPPVVFERLCARYGMPLHGCTDAAGQPQTPQISQTPQTSQKN
jgi:pantetheine-phosphate adenylyltransferase